MLHFEIECRNEPPERVFYLGQLTPAYVGRGRRLPTKVSFENGLTFFVQGGNWWYQPGAMFDMVKFHGFTSPIDIFNPDRPYCIEEILELSSEEMQDTIIFNIDIFRGIE